MTGARRVGALCVALGLGCTGSGEDGDGGTAVAPSSDGSGAAATEPGASTGDTGSVDTGSSSVGADDLLPDCPMQTYYPDADLDGYGDEFYPVDACLQPPAHIAQGGDCDDSNPEVHPGAEEVCDGFDNDCNGLVDEASASNTSCQGCALGLRDGHAYYYCPGPVPWPEARTFCMQFWGDLVVIDDQAEQDFLLGEPLPAVALFSIGLSDEAVEGTFVWVDGSPLGFSAWGVGEPNNALEGEDCVQLRVPEGVWNDIGCATASAFICEASPG